MLPEPYKGLAISEHERTKQKYSAVNPELRLFIEAVFGMQCQTMEDAIYRAFCGLYLPGKTEGEQKLSFWIAVARAYDNMEPLPEIPTFYQ